MLRMQNEIAVDELRCVPAWLCPFEHPQQVGRVAKLAIGRYRLESLADARMHRNDHGDLRGEANSLA